MYIFEVLHGVATNISHKLSCVHLLATLPKAAVELLDPSSHCCLLSRVQFVLGVGQLPVILHGHIGSGNAWATALGVEVSETVWSGNEHNHLKLIR